MRGVLVVNPTATTTGPRARDVIVRALSSDLKLDVLGTEHRGHAHDIARQARLDGVDVVIALGGDGTVNEVVNGLLADGLHGPRPALGVVPGGSTNVFARALGVGQDQVEATGLILDALREGRRRDIGLGRADERWFTFAAGLGLDAEVVEVVERRRAAGRPATAGLYVSNAVRHFFTGTERRRPALRVEPRDGARTREPVEDLFLAIVSNTSPWTYVGHRPVVPSPLASFEAGLDVFGLRRLATMSTLNHVRQLTARSGRGPRGRSVVTMHDLEAVTVTARWPVALQVDGEHLGRRARVAFTSRPRALSVLV